MLLTKEVEVTPRGKAIQYYKNKGYDSKYNQPLIVKVEDLPKSSHANIDVLCCICGKNIITTTFYNYNKKIEETGSYVCRECSYKKMQQTNLRKYGVPNVSQSQIIREKVCHTNLMKYGVSNYAQTSECRKKIEDTLQFRYGVKHCSQLSDYKEKFRRTCIEKYGYDNPSQSSEIRKKISQTFYANSSQRASKQQRYICELYQGILNFPVGSYNVDIYLPNDNLIVEYDGGGHMLNVIVGKETIEKFNQKEIVRNNIIKREGYKQMRIVSSKDLMPSNTILLQMLSDAKQYFSQYPNHRWVEFNIDLSIVCNAENKDGIPYDYGKLRKIKDSDLLNKVI